MPYAKQWRTAMYPDFKEAGAYIDYKATKDILHRMKIDIANPATPDQLLQGLRDAKKVAYDWALVKAEEMNVVARAAEVLSRQFDEKMMKDRQPTTTTATNKFVFTNDELKLINAGIAKDCCAVNRADVSTITIIPEVLKKCVDSILHETLRFHEVRNLNTDTIEHIIRRQFRYTPLQPSGKWIDLEREYDFMSISIDEIFYLLSVVYERLTVYEGRVSGATGGDPSHPSGAMGSQTFDRRSVKYWVHRQDLPFVIGRIVQHLPYSSMKDTYKEFQDAKVPFSLGQRVSSVYYDNSNFLYYHRRLERLEGCSLIRFRWYSDTLEPDINHLKPTSDVFAEIKVHHEAWSGERSTKQRFAIKAKDINDFCRGKLSLEPAIEKLRKKKTHPREIQKFRELASEILGKITSYDMKPVLRTQCNRAAFQRGADQTVRVSIDMDLRMSAEDFGLSNHWRVEDTSQFLAATMFPYAVVEVKLQCAENERLPAWIEELLKCRYMESVPKFSKYAYGIASLFAHTPKVVRVPYYEHQVHTDIRSAFKPDNESWDPTVGLADKWWQRLADRVVFGTNPPQTQTIGASQARFLDTLPPGTKKPQHEDDYDEGKSGRGGIAVENTPLTAASRNSRKACESNSFTLCYHAMLRGELKAVAAFVETEGAFALERRHRAFLPMIRENAVEPICFPGYGKPGERPNPLAGDIPWQTGKRVRVPQKFDPKTLLTCERYMLKWVQKASFIGISGIALINFGAGHNYPTSQIATRHLPFLFNNSLHIHMGVLLVIMSILICLYALLVLGARSRRVYARRKIRFDDTRGPGILTFALMSAMILIALNSVLLRYGPSLTGSDYM